MWLEGEAEREFRANCSHLNGIVGISQALWRATLWMAPVWWGPVGEPDWEQRVASRASPTLILQSERERQEELDSSQLLLRRWEPAAAALPASHKVFSRLFSTAWHFVFSPAAYCSPWLKDLMFFTEMQQSPQAVRG